MVIENSSHESVPRSGNRGEAMNESQVVLFESSDGEVRLPVAVEDDSVWLSQS